MLHSLQVMSRIASTCLCDSLKIGFRAVLASGPGSVPAHDTADTSLEKLRICLESTLFKRKRVMQTSIPTEADV